MKSDMSKYLNGVYFVNLNKSIPMSLQLKKIGIDTTENTRGERSKVRTIRPQSLQARKRKKERGKRI